MNVSGSFVQNIETTGIAFFKKNEIPENLAKEKTTKEQIELCFQVYHDPSLPTFFD